MGGQSVQTGIPQEPKEIQRGNNKSQGLVDCCWQSAHPEPGSRLVSAAGLERGARMLHGGQVQQGDGPGGRQVGCKVQGSSGSWGRVQDDSVGGTGLEN